MQHHGERFSDIRQPLALGSFRNWLRLLWSSGGVDRMFLRRAAFISSVSFLTIPFRIWERVRYRELNNGTSLDASPIFIVGHWRSGTTLLHQLLCRDPAFGYVSTFQTIAPEWFLTCGRTVESWLARAIPSTRMMDNMRLNLDDPQEEEFAMAEMSPFSFYHQWSFPRNAREYFDKYAMFHNVPDSVVCNWKKAYLRILHKATFNSGGKQLVIKNPINTARIETLLEMFPNAKFVHIYRNPYTVFLSTRHFFRCVLGSTQLQAANQDEIEANILYFYEQMMRRFLDEKRLIPQGNLVELRFEEFEAQPLDGLRQVYDGLRLPGFDAAEDRFRDHLASLAGYRKNRYDLSDDVIRKVEEHWGFAIDRWGYKVPQSQADKPQATIAP
jgi:hypothetical protein